MPRISALLLLTLFVALAVGEAAPNEKPAWASASGQDEFGAWAELKVGDLTQRFRWIPPGTFQMGSPPDEAGRSDDETQHEVTLSSGFWLADSECTQALWKKVMGNNPSYFPGNDSHPVERVSRVDCVAFLQKLTPLTKGGTCALPSEAQWEYACRAGTTGSLSSNLAAMAWYNQSSTQPVKTKAPNPWGLYDMLGNVSEWTADWSGDYAPGPQRDPRARGADDAGARIFRGGSWDLPPLNCRPAARDYNEAGSARSIRGFRIMLKEQGEDR